MPGTAPTNLNAPEQDQLADTLGQFLRTLHDLDTGNLEPGADRWGYRAGEPVTDEIDSWAEASAVDLRDMFDPAGIREAWRRLRAVPPASEPPCWVHTDLAAENLLTGTDGRLSGVIDFGGLGIGDRSVDLLYAWSLFDQPARERCRAAAGVDGRHLDPCSSLVVRRARAPDDPSLPTHIAAAHRRRSRKWWKP